MGLFQNFKGEVILYSIRRGRYRAAKIRFLILLGYTTHGFEVKVETRLINLLCERPFGYTLHGKIA